MRFVDLFAGMGGYHRALSNLGHECVFASEIDPALQELYRRNFPSSRSLVYGDIRANRGLVPRHDILCAGFPCQPFSKSGEQLGTNDRTRGTLFHEIIDVIRIHHPQYVLLENVGNFERHDGGKTWQVVKESLLGLGYNVQATEHITPPPTSDWRERGGARMPESHVRRKDSLATPVRVRGHGLVSPHHLGFPQHRERFFVVATLRPLTNDPFPETTVSGITTSLEDICQMDSELTPQDKVETTLTEQQVRCITHWNRLLAAIPVDVELPSFPIWGEEANARYPYAHKTPWATRPGELGQLLPGGPFPRWTRRSELLALLPSYAREEANQFPAWKVRFIRQNRDWFALVKDNIPSGWIEALRMFPPSLQKLEWNCRGEERDLWQHVLQFRPSGLRAKRFVTCPALVAMTTTQIPILGPKRRFISRIEGLRLQGFPDDHMLPASRDRAFSALGNAVHVGVAQEIARRVFGSAVRTYRRSRYGG